MAYRLVDFFIDPILRAPTIGSMLMCSAASLVGVIVFIRRKSLVGEALSHAAYPGLVLSAFGLSFFFPSLEDKLFVFLLMGAFLAALLGLLFIQGIQARFKVKSDAALCFVLSSFFGVGILFASRMQGSSPLWYRQIQTFLYGQAATMTDFHVWMYGALFCLVASFIILFYRPIQLVYFDRQFAGGVGLPISLFEMAFVFLLVLAVTVAMKSVGVVLLSGMLIAPALGARRMSHKLSVIFLLSSLMGALSGFLGNYFSVKFSEWLPSGRFVFPTGPMIVLAGSLLCLLSLLFAPKKGHFMQSFRKKRFANICKEEELLKVLWRVKENLTLEEIASRLQSSSFSVRFLLKKLVASGLLLKSQNAYSLSLEGESCAKEITHLHKLWEAHLIYIGPSREKVSVSSKEMLAQILLETREKTRENP